MVDDRSGEDLGPLIGGFRDRLDVRWTASAAKGRPGARNTGAAEARGRILWFLDDDMTVAPGTMEEHNRTLAGGCEVSIGAIESSSGGKSLWNALDDSRFDLHREQTAVAPEGPPFTAFFTGNLAMEGRAFRELGGFDQETFSFYGGEDFDLGLRCINSGFRIVHTPAALAYHHDEKIGYGRYLARCRWSAASMARFVGKHPKVAERPDFLEIESGPLRNTGNRPGWRTLPVLIFMTPPIAELMLAVAQGLWITGLSRMALALAAFSKRFYFNRHLARALGGRPVG